MKNNYAWAKTLLTIYKYLERITGAIDKIILQSAINSSNICGQNYYYNNIHAISDKIINLSERKVLLINLKVLVDEILQSLPEKESVLLIGKFVEGFKCKEMVIQYDVSLRNMFRKIDGAVKMFSNKLNKMGFNDSKLSKMLKDEGWILNCHERFCAEKEDVKIEKIVLAKAVSM